MKIESSAPVRFTPSPRILSTLAGVSVMGLLVFLIGLLVAPRRIWAGYLVGFNYLVGLGLSGGVFLAVIFLANATWARPLRRIPEAMTAAIPWAGLLGLGLLFGIHSLYEWSHESVVANDPLLLHKAAYLNAIGFSLRLVLFFAVWILFLRHLVQRSRADTGGAASRKSVVVSALFMVVLTITFSLASFDWLMSLEAHWFSTLFALYRLAGAGMTGLATVILLAVASRRAGPVRVTDDQLNDLGRLLLGLSVFWVYLWYCQYMLIWYTNIPEETAYYALRSEAPWKVLTPVTLVLNWAIPFLVLLPRAACRSEKILVRVAGVVMMGQMIDLYQQVCPPLMQEDPVFGIWELAPPVAAVALFFLVTLRALGREPEESPCPEPADTKRTPAIP